MNIPATTENLSTKLRTCIWFIALHRSSAKTGNPLWRTISYIYRVYLKCFAFSTNYNSTTI